MKKEGPKLKLGIYSFTSCGGCIIAFIEAMNHHFEWMEKNIEFVDFKELKTFKKISKTDLALIEGAISTKEEIKRVKEIRENTKRLVVIGSCGITGFPSTQRNDFNKNHLKMIEGKLKKFKHLKKVKLPSDFVKVDSSIKGCPVEEKKLLRELKKAIRKNA